MSNDVSRPASLGARAMVAASLVGIALGLGFFTAGYADVASYLTDDPSACGNCHVMDGYVDAWSKSAHARGAVCNDCHASHDGLVPKYASKAINGFNHSLAFTTGGYPENLLLRPFNRRITEDACRSCHEGLVHGIDVVAGGGNESLVCTSCHATVGHDR